MSERELLAKIHEKAAACLANSDVLNASGLFNEMEEIWNMTLDAFEGVHGPNSDDGRDFTPPYEP